MTGVNKVYTWRDNSRHTTGIGKGLQEIVNLVYM
jgi:hypothetical protein